MRSAECAQGQPQCGDTQGMKGKLVHLREAPSAQHHRLGTCVKEANVKKEGRKAFWSGVRPRPRTPHDSPMPVPVPRLRFLLCCSDSCMVQRHRLLQNTISHHAAFFNAASPISSVETTFASTNEISLVHSCTLNLSSQSCSCTETVSIGHLV